MRLINLSIKVFLITNFIFISSLSANSFKNLSIPDSMEFKLNNYEYNQYLRRGMRAYVDSEINGGKGNIKKKYKKWVNADIVLKNKSIKAKVRIMGDWKDHLRLPLTSLKVRIPDDSYHGVTRFNLYLPHTRNGENEVFWNLMLSYLNFPVLYTKMIDVNFNGNRYRAIFQEDSTKEFLERNHITETVILKQNDFWFYLNKFEKDIYDNNFSSSFVIDNNNFLKNEVSSSIVSEAIAYASDSEFKERILNEEFFFKIMKDYSNHGLAEHNRKYIYLPFKKMFIPLYYDGMIEFPPNKANCNKKVNKEVFDKFKKDYLSLSNKKLSPIQLCVFQDVYSQYIKRKKENLNYKFINKNLVYQERYSNIKKKIISYLNEGEKKDLKVSKSIIYTFLYNSEYHKCFFDILKNRISICEKINFDEYSQLISQSGSSKKIDNFSAFPINLGSFDNSIPFIELLKDEKEFILDAEATYLFTNKKIKNKTIKFLFKNSKSKLIINGTFENIDFQFDKDFENKNIEYTNIRYDKNLLTGCVNFFESNFNNVNITGKNMACEDSVNIKNSTGQINKISIENSLYDAVDLDFSNLNIKLININNAKNDCADFSFGNYDITEVVAKKCGDKGLSIGEKSKANLKNISITESKIGVASKDSSVTIIENISMNKLEICLSAYKKKKEFSGSKMRIKKLSCDNFYKKIHKDNLSDIFVENEI
tara:strand:+ start:1187 stop:3304 length:2118 start_codon:yes stop_codon:yes gene_type:complete